jgi:hypothetical protein
MNWQDVAIGTMSVLLVLFGAVLRTLWDATQKLTADVHQIEKDMPETYVRRDDFKSHADRIESMIQRLIDKLDGKVDKP